MEGRDDEVRKVKVTISFEEWEQSWEKQSWLWFGGGEREVGGGGRWKTSGSVSVKVLRCRVEVYCTCFTISIYTTFYYGYATKLVLE